MSLNNAFLGSPERQASLKKFFKPASNIVIEEHLPQLPKLDIDELDYEQDENVIPVSQRVFYLNFIYFRRKEDWLF